MIPVLINGNAVRSGSIRIGPAWDTIDVLLVRIEVTGQNQSKHSV